MLSAITTDKKYTTGSMGCQESKFFGDDGKKNMKESVVLIIREKLIKFQIESNGFFMQQ